MLGRENVSSNGNNLTLTRVVFELKKDKDNEPIIFDLTLTRVVFEFTNEKVKQVRISDLTLTRVVFEFGISWCSANFR